MKHLYRPSELHAHLKKLSTHPKKSLSQNFLIDQNILKKMISLAKIEKDDWVLEIGPGIGTLTEALLEKEANVIAIEKDHLLASSLKERLNSSHLHLFEDDFLTFPLSSLNFLTKGKKIIVVSNLPYQITSLIFAHLLKEKALFSKFIVMVQKEVGKRICAKEKEKEYSSLSVFIQSHAKVHFAFEVSPKSFFPQPKIFSAVLEIILNSSFPYIEEFHQFVKMMFSQRRKMIRSILKKIEPKERLEKILKETNLSPSSRPEELSVSSFFDLFQKIPKDFF